MYKNYYWLFKNAISKKVCDKIIEQGLSKEKLEAETGNINKTINKKLRNSSLVWLEEKWIYDLILPILHTANKNAGWNFQIDWSESCQFTMYQKKQYYNWHCDIFSEPYPMNYKFESFRGKTRKLSMSICLSEKNDFLGGDFQFDYRNKDNGKPNIETIKDLKNKGNVIVFPSNVYHRITPIKKGTRYSLVNWFLGYPFK